MVRATRSAPPRHRRKIAYGIGAAVVLIAAITTAVIISSQPAAPQPVAYNNISRNFKTCLLTTNANTTLTASAWTAIQTAARNRPINAQHLVAPAGAIDTLIPYLNSLISLHCQLIITAGPDLTTTLTTVAKTYPHQQFANISPVTTNLANVRDLPDDAPASILNLVTSTCDCR